MANDETKDVDEVEAELSPDVDSLPDDFLDGFLPKLERYRIHIGPSDDVDDYVRDCNFRIERLGTDGLWVCAYTNDPELPDIHYNIRVTDAGELEISRSAEPSPDSD